MPSTSTDPDGFVGSPRRSQTIAAGSAAGSEAYASTPVNPLLPRNFIDGIHISGAHLIETVNLVLSRIIRKIVAQNGPVAQIPCRTDRHKLLGGTA